MTKFVIERDLPGAGDLSPENIQQMARDICGGMIGLDMSWIGSYITNNHMYCVYEAHNETQVLDHATRSGIPVTRIERVHAIIAPHTANGFISDPVDPPEEES